jgi:hypothetical protein
MEDDREAGLSAAETKLAPVGESHGERRARALRRLL